MMKKLFVFLSVLIIMSVVFVSGQVQFGGTPVVSQGSSFQSQFGSNFYVDYNPQPNFQTYYTAQNINEYWPVLRDEAGGCFGRQDFVLQVSPGGCEPAVVRSDLLAEQNVPVFCQIDALQLNPLINVREIKNIRFSGEYPAEVAGTGFHPARAALRDGSLAHRLRDRPMLSCG